MRCIHFPFARGRKTTYVSFNQGEKSDVRYYCFQNFPYLSIVRRTHYKSALWLSPSLSLCWPLRKGGPLYVGCIFPPVYMHSSNKRSHSATPQPHLTLSLGWLVGCCLGEGKRLRRVRKGKIYNREDSAPLPLISATLPAHLGRLVLSSAGAETTDRDTFSGTDRSETALPETALPARKVTPCPRTRSFYHHVRPRDIFSEQASKYESGSEPFVKELY